MKVKIIYRNYKPLHKIYESLVQSPPQEVEYIVPPTLTRFNNLYGVYKKIKFLPFIKTFVHTFEQVFFLQKTGHEDVDLYHYINIIDENPPEKPYVVDIEHAASLVSFTPDKRRINKVVTFLQNPYCKSIECLSEAAKISLKRLLGPKYTEVQNKVSVVYPALQGLDKSFKDDYEYIDSQKATLKLLFVGNQAYLKGLEELLETVKRLNNLFASSDLELHVVSDDGAPIVERYGLVNVYLYKPHFSKQEIFCKFFMPADVFVMPTKEDTFGMAVLDSLACGTAVVSTRQFAIPELVSDGRDGILVNLKEPLLDTTTVPNKEDMASVTQSNLDEDMVEQLVSVLSRMLNGEIDARILGHQGKGKFRKGGKFAVDTRNETLLNIYRHALKDV